MIVGVIGVMLGMGMLLKRFPIAVPCRDGVNLGPHLSGRLLPTLLQH